MGPSFLFYVCKIQEIFLFFSHPFIDLLIPASLSVGGSRSVITVYIDMAPKVLFGLIGCTAYWQAKAQKMTTCKRFLP